MAKAREVTINFLALQAGQQAHDELAGRRVGPGGWPEFRKDAVISFDARVGEAYGAPPEELPGAVAAIFAATLRIANSLNFDLRPAVSSISLITPIPASNPSLVQSINSALVKLNKAAGAADHGEDFPVIPTYKVGVLAAVDACLAASRAHQFDLTHELTRYWQRSLRATPASALLF